MFKLPSFLKKGIYLLLVLIQLSSVFLSPVFSDDISDLENEVDEKNEQVEEKESTLEQVKKEIENIKKSSASLDEKIVLMDKELKNIDKYIEAAAKEIELKEEKLGQKESGLENKKEDLNNISSVLYKRSRVGFVEFLLSNANGEDFLKSIIFKRFTILSYVEDVRNISQEYAELKQEKIDLETEKKGLDDERKGLKKAKDELMAEKAKVQAQIAARNSAISKLGKDISLLKEEISELQTAILLAKSGSAITGVGDVPQATDSAANWANAPSGYFGVFAFGAYTHRDGMSQYGALGRAKAGHSYTQILNAYYGKTPTTVNTSGNITVTGKGSMDFETKYLYGIAEMPASWGDQGGMEALKAQAVAARTYAYRYKKDGTAICATESCQVWNESKANNPPAKWKQAVDQTVGKVLNNVVTFYSSTSGGYLDTSGWDTTDKTGGSGTWTNRAWEGVNRGNSPWFYKPWFRLGYSNSSSSCGRTPWMSQEEMGDIINTWLVTKGIDVKGSVDSSRILPVTINSCQFGSGGGNPYSMSEMRGLLNNPVVSITGNPVISNNGSGSTVTVSFVTNRGAINIPGTEFKEIFNTRAPGYLSIPQFGFTFINIQRK